MQEVVMNKRPLGLAKNCFILQSKSDLAGCKYRHGDKQASVQSNRASSV